MGTRKSSQGKLGQKSFAKIVRFSVAPDILHPVVRTHPVSGLRSIFISDNFLERFHQMTVMIKNIARIAKAALHK